MKFDIVLVFFQMFIIGAIFNFMVDANLFFRLTVLMIAAKAMVIGSEFNFDALRKHGESYWRWYMQRQNFNE